jgi:hypothetical protein
MVQYRCSLPYHSRLPMLSMFVVPTYLSTLVGSRAALIGNV